MYGNVKVLDTHSHIHDIPMTARGEKPRLAYQFWHDLYFIPGFGAARPIPSPIGPGKHSDRPGNTDEDFKAVSKHLADYIHARSIDHQIISPHPLQFHGWLEDENIFKSWIAYQNDLAFKIVQAEPETFLGAIQLPQRVDKEDSSHMLEELERCVTEYGFVEAYVSPDPTGKGDCPPLNMPYWFPLYEKAQELGIPLMIHGTDNPNPIYHQMDINRYFEFSFMFPQSLALATLRDHPEIFERFPGLKIIVCHCGGFLDRLGEDAIFRVKKNKEALSGGLFYDTAAYDPEYLALAIKQRGPSQFVFGTEAPGSGIEKRPGTDTTADDIVPLFASDPALSFLTEEDKINILHNNPAKLAPGLADAAKQNAKAKVKAYE
jgi:predicted TIM-barrel fold metal-dependent hydrolase